MNTQQVTMLLFILSFAGNIVLLFLYLGKRKELIKTDDRIEAIGQKIEELGRQKQEIPKHEGEMYLDTYLAKKQHEPTQQERYEEWLAEQEGRVVTPPLPKTQQKAKEQPFMTIPTGNQESPQPIKATREQLKCPKCYSKLIKKGIIRTSQNGMEQELICKNCGAKWVMIQEI